MGDRQLPGSLVCVGLGMTLGEFFSAAEFDALEQEIV